MSALHHSHPEEDQRLPLQTAKGKWVPNPEQAEQIRKIDEWMTANAISNKELSEFCACAGETIHHIRNGTYGANGSNVLRKIIQGVTRFTTTKAQVAKLSLRQFYSTPEFEAFQEALGTAAAQADVGSECRLVVAALKGGWGKTEWCKRTQQPGDAIIHAVPSWKTSYRSILVSMLRAISPSELGEKKQRRSRSIQELEDSLLTTLRDSRRTIYIQELSPFNVSSVLIELLRLILNETKAVVALMVVPAFLERIRELGGETANQLFRRGMVVECHEVKKSLAAKFLAESFAQDPALDECAKLLAASASQTWGPHLCREVTNRLAAELSANHTPLTKSRVEKEIAATTASWSFQRHDAA